MTTAVIGGYIARMDKYVYVDDLIPDSIPKDAWLSEDSINKDSNALYVKGLPMNFMEIECEDKDLDN